MGKEKNVSFPDGNVKQDKNEAVAKNPNADDSNKSPEASPIKPKSILKNPTVKLPGSLKRDKKLNAKKPERQKSFLNKDTPLEKPVRRRSIRHTQTDEPLASEAFLTAQNEGKREGGQKRKRRKSVPAVTPSPIKKAKGKDKRNSI